MSIITCPNCKSPLSIHDGGMTCENGHSFDRAKEGYVNLLISNMKKSNNPGDSKQMIRAREDFLSKGHFDFLIDEIDDAITSAIDFKVGGVNLLDLGCGSGYYTRTLCKEKEINKFGIDISKIGVAKAAKKDKSSTYLVASIFDLPIIDDSIDIILNVFSPIRIDEVKRVMKPGGLLIKVIPVADHMKEVANLVYDEFVPHQSSIETELMSSAVFQKMSSEHLLQKVSLQSDEMRSFIAMTPYLYKFTEKQLEEIRAMDITLSFQVIIAKSLA